MPVGEERRSYRAGGMNCRPPPRSLPDGLEEVREKRSGLQQRSSSTLVGVAEAVSVAVGDSVSPGVVLAVEVAVSVAMGPPEEPPGRSTR